MKLSKLWCLGDKHNVQCKRQGRKIKQYKVQCTLQLIQYLVSVTAFRRQWLIDWFHISYMSHTNYIKMFGTHQFWGRIDWTEIHTRKMFPNDAWHQCYLMSIPVQQMLMLEMLWFKSIWNWLIPITLLYDWYNWYKITQKIQT